MTGQRSLLSQSHCFPTARQVRRVRCRPAFSGRCFFVVNFFPRTSAFCLKKLLYGTWGGFVFRRVCTNYRLKWFYVCFLIVTDRKYCNALESLPLHRHHLSYATSEKQKKKKKAAWPFPCPAALSVIFRRVISKTILSRLMGSV